MLKAKNFKDDDINALFKFIDWLLILPVSLTMAFEENISKYKEEGKMRYITSLELYERRKGRTEGINVGRTDGINVGINTTADLVLNRLKNFMTKDQYDKMVPSLQLELQELRTKSAALVTQ